MPYNQPGRSEVHVDRPLTNVAVAFRQSADRFISDRAFPVVPVSKQSDTYFTVPRGAWFRDEMQKNAPGDEPAYANYTMSSDSYRCDVWKLAKALADQVRANYDSPLQPDREMTEFLTLKAMISKETQWVNNFFATSIWTGDLTGVSGAPGASQFQRWDEAASTPIEDIRLGAERILERTGEMPNKLILGRAVYNRLLDHPDIVGRIDRGQTTGAAVVMRQNLAALFEMDEILVLGGVQNTGAEGAADSFSFIGGKAALLVYAPPSAGIYTPSAGYTFSWTGLLGGGALGTRMRRIRDDKAEADILEIAMAYAHKVVSADLGQFFATAVN